MSSEKQKIIAVGQFCAHTCDVGKNLEKMEALVREAASVHAGLLVLPELAVTGYRADEEFARLAQPLDGEYVRELSRMSRENGGIWLYTSIPEKAEGTVKPYNTAVLVNSDGLEADYRKIHLWGRETEYFSAGDMARAAQTPLGRAGLHICFDVSFPEAARYSALDGAELLLYAFAFSNPERRYAFDIFTQARALENGCYVAAANLSGCEKDSIFFGGSRIIDPAGRVIAEIQRDEGVVTATCDERLLGDIRVRYPYLQRRRPETYL